MSIRYSSLTGEKLVPEKWLYCQNKNRYSPIEDEFGHAWDIGYDGNIYIKPNSSSSWINTNDITWSYSTNQMFIMSILNQQIRKQTLNGATCMCDFIPPSDWEIRDCYKRAEHIHEDGKIYCDEHYTELTKLPVFINPIDTLVTSSDSHDYLEEEFKKFEYEIQSSLITKKS